ncbi:hypothetical protein BFP72_02010 [Reichenbachiella sp. 5M10]|uniref:SdiA-regulated domain-containing protein n=1 Tax=Reichenbachiella sp. 5M10 TaxID=1889772 RepID=UPI000C14F6AA|nr:SdiA-regulated domain-containing protein [Reichenbachiella sp. 5M10]PIB34291.1 hypothetical protein BFP72_02010 [Reichenbachiella sp. 5M10]
MRVLLLIALVTIYIEDSWAQPSYPALELRHIVQLQTDDARQFDLSGIVRIAEHTYVIADKPWNTYLYEVRTQGPDFTFSKEYAFRAFAQTDLEAVDYCDELFYLADELNGQILRFRLDTTSGPLITPQILPIDFESAELRPHTWGNAGWEGLAIDCGNQTMYLIKERQPRFILTIDMESGKITDKFNIPETESGDFSDAKYENGYLYLIERNGNYITKINPKTHEVIDKVHYRHIASHHEGKLYGPEKYGMAEALLLLDDEIWIGLDNNGKSVTKHAQDTHGLMGNTPIILQFSRPKGF